MWEGADEKLTVTGIARPIRPFLINYLRADDRMPRGVDVNKRAATKHSYG